MWRRKKTEKTNQSETNIFPLKVDALEKFFKEKFNYHDDLKFTKYTVNKKKVAVFYIDYLIEGNKLGQIIEPLVDLNPEIDLTNKNLLNELPFSSGTSTN